MIIRIDCFDERYFFFESNEEFFVDMNFLQIEFMDWLNSLKGPHPYLQYNETVENDNSVSFAEFVNFYGPEEFMDWVNVEKYDNEVFKRIFGVVDKYDVTIRF